MKNFRGGGVSCQLFCLILYNFGKRGRIYHANDWSRSDALPLACGKISYLFLPMGFHAIFLTVCFSAVREEQAVFLHRNESGFCLELR